MMFTQFQTRVKVFRADNRGAYVNNAFACFFHAHGIIHQMTTPFTPQQNGVSKMKNRQLLEVTRSLTLDMSVLHHLLGHAIMFAAYLINRTRSQSKLDPCALRCVFIGYSSTQKGYKCYHLAIQKRERGSELESLGLELENHVFKDIALGKETIGRTDENDRSPRSGD
ncbi:hypothetical protein L3X38_036638 [Prunus dulcis]|uniref:Integrase catalytic domain-containing protein n=1 Tax=Prunus dulcis TaxID=3755 RepID=A0AAD4V358_PRUDU|nr:hypothetical protein L3X38_036638 [Prunus dulcis]